MQRLKSNSPTFLSALSVYLAHLLPASAMDVAVTVEEEEEMHVPIHVRAPVLGRARVLGLDHGLGPPGLVGGAILTSLRNMAGTVEGVEVGSGSVEEVGGEAGVVDIVITLGLVLYHLVGVLDPHADGRRAMSVAGTEGAEQGHLHTLCALAAHADLTLVLVPAPHALARGRALCLTLPTRGTVGAGAGVALVLVL